MRWWQRFLNMRQAQNQLDRELRFHIEQQVAEYIAAGVPLEEAQRQARLEFGGLDQVKEDCREARRGHLLETVIQDIRHGFRVLRKAPGFTFVAVVTLALGIGANTAIFSMVDTIMLRPLPVRNAHDLTFLRFPRDATHFDPQFSIPEFRQIAKQTRGIFSDVTAISLGGGPGGREDGLTVDRITRPAQTLFVTGNFFEMLGIRPYLGRFILPSEGNAPDGDPVVVLSYRYWKRRFNGDATVLNKPAFVNGRPVTIVGIGPKDFLGPTPIVEMQAYLPIGMITVETGGKTDFLTDPNDRRLLVVGRLASGVNLERANSGLVPLGAHLLKEYPRPGINTALQTHFLRPPGLIDGPNPLPALAALFLTLSGLVLALACLNVTNLSMVRAAGRQREMAVRASLGGSRTRLVRQLLTEMMLVAILGAGAGMLVGTLALHALTSEVTITEMPLVFEFPFNARVFIFALAIAVLAGAIVGIIPALRASSGNLSDILHEGGRSSTTRSQRTRTALVAAQVGGSLALLIVAGLFVRSLRSAQHADLGFEASHLLNVVLDPGEIGYTQVQATGFYAQLIRRVRQLPGVQSASLAMAVPLDNFSGDDFRISGQVPQRGEQLHADFDAVSADYFTTMSIPILQGRDFLVSDSESSQRVAIINQTMAERFWHGESPIGKSLKRNGDPTHTLEIVGVVRNSRTQDTYSPYSPTFYVPLSQNFTSAQTLQIRTAGPPEAVAPEILTAVRSIAPTAPVLSVRTMADSVMNGPDGLLIFSLGAELTAGLGLLGLIIAIVGIYGVMVYAVEQRTQEIGVRIALGAQRKAILWLISRQAVAILGIGLTLGLVVALGMGQLVGNFLVGVTPTDPLTFIAVSMLLSLVVLAAGYVPAQRAMRVDPMTALRHE